MTNMERELGLGFWHSKMLQPVLVKMSNDDIPPPATLY
jgi:hypothetical protein